MSTERGKFSTSNRVGVNVCAYECMYVFVCARSWMTDPGKLAHHRMAKERKMWCAGKGIEGDARNFTRDMGRRNCAILGGAHVVVDHDEHEQEQEDEEEAEGSVEGVRHEPIGTLGGQGKRGCCSRRGDDEAARHGAPIG
jgi:hypothetical protein